MVDITKIAYLAPPYPVDKIAFIEESSFAVNNGAPGSATKTVTHNLNQKCLTELVWSFDGGSSFQDVGVVDIDGDTFTGDTIHVTATCGTNTATIYAENSSGSNKTINYRIYLIWPS